MIHLVPSYLPSLIYYWHIVNSNVIFNLSTKYQKQTTRNRCMIMSANGPQKLIIPVRHSRKENEILHDYNVKIDNTQNWKVKHWKSIQNAYRSSPFFEFYEEGFFKVFFNNEKLLYSFNMNIISHINNILGVQKNIEISNRKLSHEKYDKKLMNIKKYLCYNVPPYNQVFMSKFKFIPNLSILDLIFNMGPKSINYLVNPNFNQTHSN